MNKTKVIAVRVTEHEYNALEYERLEFASRNGDAYKEGRTLSQYVHSLLNEDFARAIINFAKEQKRREKAAAKVAEAQRKEAEKKREEAAAKRKATREAKKAANDTK